jgi:hypothetical protein
MYLEPFDPGMKGRWLFDKTTSSTSICTQLGDDVYLGGNSTCPGMFALGESTQLKSVAYDRTTVSRSFCRIELAAVQ